MRLYQHARIALRTAYYVYMYVVHTYTWLLRGLDCLLVDSVAYVGKLRIPTYLVHAQLRLCMSQPLIKCTTPVCVSLLPLHLRHRLRACMRGATQ